MSNAQHLVLGTAGHIDHGKTALIKALTGTDTDRLREEKERGISIQLGYAELELPSGTTMSVVDVPGHEKFIRNMVAGATGIDIFLLVVSADDGVMPQTREHMAIIELLGIPQGVVAITKIDLVDKELVELVQADVEEFLSTTLYKGAPIVAVSSKTGAGLPQLLGTLEDAASKAKAAHQVSGAARLPVDRVFTLKGIGTVVTGTLWSGQICTDDSLKVLPDDLPARARTVQVHDRSVTCAEAGQRVAINLSGISKERLARGQMIVKGEGLKPTYMVDAKISLLDSAPQLKYGAQVRLHHGTADATAKLMFADRDQLQPAESCYAQVRLKTKIVPVQGDRFILRSLSPVTTIGGGVVIDPNPKKHGKGKEHVRRLQILEKGNPTEVVSLLLNEAAPAGLSLGELKASSRLPTSQIKETLVNPEVAALKKSPGGFLYFSPKAVSKLEKDILKALKKRQEQSPADPSMTSEELAKIAALPSQSASFQALLLGLTESGKVTTNKQRYFLASAKVRLSSKQQQLFDSIALSLKESGLTPPSLMELTATSGAIDKDTKIVIKLLEEKGLAIKVKPDLYYSPAAVEQARQTVVDRCHKTGKITLAEFRDLIGVSRKFAQALLEYFDRTGLTRRVEDYRVLRKRGSS